MTTNETSDTKIPVLAQFVKLIPPFLVTKVANKVGIKRGQTRTFSLWSQLVAMIYSHVAGSVSPFIDMQMTWAHAHPDAPFEVHVFVGVSVFLLAIATSYAALKVFDIPVREWLQKKWLRSRKSKS